MALRSLILAATIALGAASITSVTASGAPSEARSMASQAREAAPHSTAKNHRAGETSQAAQPTAEKRGASYTKRLARAMNNVREKHDLKPLRVTGCLTKVASKWARHLAKTGKFEHQNLAPILKRCELRRVGEILAKGSVTPKQMIRMWLDSPGHRELLLDPGFRKAGVAAKRDSNGSWIGCIDFGRG